MSWRKIPMKFPGTCIICKEKINVNEIGLWAKDLGVKHEKCAEITELQCMICGKSAGCSQCEFQESCDIPNVSSFCLCKQCVDDTSTLTKYKKSTNKKFSILNS